MAGLVALTIRNKQKSDGPTGAPETFEDSKVATKLAPSWYVSPKGLDTNDGRSPGSAFASIQKALNSALPGDAIQLADGQYEESFNSVRNGKKDAPITLQGSRRAVVVGNKSRVVEIHHDYIHLVGFAVSGLHGNKASRDGYRDKLIYVIGTEPRKGVEGLKLHDMLIENAGGECVRLRYFAVNNEISNTTVRNCGIYDFKFNEGGKNGEGIYIGTAPEQLGDGKNPTADPDVSTNNWIHHNFIDTNANECVDVKEASHDNIIEHNKCTGQQDDESGGMDARGDYNTFRNNEIYDNVGAGVRLGGDSDDDGTGNHIYDNIIRDNGGPAIKILRWPQGKMCGNETRGNRGGAFGGEFGESLEPESCR